MREQAAPLSDTGACPEHKSPKTWLLKLWDFPLAEGLVLDAFDSSLLAICQGSDQNKREG